MVSLPGVSYVGRVVLGEHELLEVAREDEALVVFRARSQVDGGAYTVALLREVVPTSGATEIAGAAARASRQAMGIPGLLPLVVARTDDGQVWAVRRGEPGRSVAEELDRPRTFRETHALVVDAAKALAGLHDIGLFHGAITPFSFVRLDDRDRLDWAGLSTVAEASGGFRALAAVVDGSFRPPELAGDVPSSLGPWSDIHAFARVVVALLAGTRAPRGDLDGLTLPPALTAALSAALTPSPARRPTDLGPLLAALGAAGDGQAIAKTPFVAVGGAPPNDERTEVISRENKERIAETDALGAGLPEGLGEATSPAPSAEPPALLAPIAAPPPAALPVTPEAPKRRDPLALVIALTTAFAGLLVLGGAGGLVYHLLGPTPAVSSSAVPVLTAPVMPAPTATATATGSPPMAPGTPAPLGTEPDDSSPGSPTPSPAPDRAPTAFTPRPVGEISSGKDDEDALLPVLADDPTRGDRRAPVTMVVFADLTCPHSLRLLSSLPLLEASLGDTLRVVVKVYPLPDRKGAVDAAEAALTVRKKGGNAAFYAFLLAMGRAGGRVDPGSLEEIAIKAGAPAGAVTEGLRTHAEKSRVETNVVQGRRMAVTATPVVFLNGRRYDGLLPWTALESEIKAESIRARAALSRGTLPDQVYKARVFSNVTTAEADGPRR